jgi:hypothetical protein
MEVIAMMRGFGLLCLAVPLLFAGCSDDTPSGGSPVDWQIMLDDQGPGVHTVHMIVDFGPAGENSNEGELEASGRLVWEQDEVELCGIGFRNEVEEGHLGVGDIFQTTEGCDDDPTAMQDAFEEFGPPTEGCVEAMLDGSTYEYCAPLPIDERS